MAPADSSPGSCVPEAEGNTHLSQFFPQERIGQRGHVSSLPVVGRAAMPPFDVLVVQHVVPLLLHSGHHLPRMTRVDAIVAGGSGEEDTGVLLVFPDVLIRGVLADISPILR